VVEIEGVILGVRPRNQKNLKEISKTEKKERNRGAPAAVQ
jgi:hypothetical protein